MLNDDQSAVDYLLVGGGGGGGISVQGDFRAGGGGAGGLIYTTNTSIPAGTYPIVVGSGGRAAPGNAGTVAEISGGNGGDTIAFSTTATGGGGGGGRWSANIIIDAASCNDPGGITDAFDGGSGGGGSVNACTGSTTNSGQGNNGGGATNAGGGGGGGAVAVGGSGAVSGLGLGGTGRSITITGSAVTYATGGDGARSGRTPENKVAGSGNGGDGGVSASPPTAGANGVVVVVLPSVSIHPLTLEEGTTETTSTKIAIHLGAFEFDDFLTTAVITATATSFFDGYENLFAEEPSFSFSDGNNSTLVETLEMAFQLKPFVSGITTFTIAITDDGKPEVGNPRTGAIQVVMDVLASNDEPSIVFSSNPVTVDEDSASTLNSVFVLSLGPGEIDDIFSTTLSEVIITNDVNGVLSSTPKLVVQSDEAGRTTLDLTYQTAADAFGTATLSVKLVDQYNGSNPEVLPVNTSVTTSLQIIVTPVNDTPTITSTALITLSEDSQNITTEVLIFDLGVFEIQDSVDSSASTMTEISGAAVFRSTPVINTTGVLATNSTGVLSLEAINLAADQVGTATLVIELFDTAAGGDYRGGALSTTVSITIAVKQVNDTPTITTVFPMAVDEDSGSTSC